MRTGSQPRPEVSARKLDVSPGRDLALPRRSCRIRRIRCRREVGCGRLFEPRGIDGRTDGLTDDAALSQASTYRAAGCHGCSSRAQV